MPKQKTHSASKKRFVLKKSVLIKRNKQNHRHILTKKNKDRKRQLGKATYVSSANERTIKTLLGA